MSLNKLQPLFVVAGVIRKGEKYLITKRPDDGRDNGGRWEFPGGKLDFGESPRESLKRELFEEMGITVAVEDLIEISSKVYSETLHVILVAFRCIHLKGEIQKKEIQDYAWVTIDEMSSYDITQADQIFIKKLQHYSFYP